MNTSWKLQDAEANFSEVIENALKSGPQYVTRSGKDAVVVVSASEYEKIKSKKATLKEFLLNCPKMEDDFEFERQKDYPRDMDF